MYEYVHCTVHILRIRYGYLYYSCVGRHHRDYIDEGTEQLLSLSKVIAHERFDENDDLDNDIAVLELRTPAQLNNKVGTVCLPTSDVPAVGTNCIITG